MYIVVSNTNKIPSKLSSFAVELWPLDEFITKAGSDEGIDIEEGLWIDVAVLNKDIYDAICSDEESKSKILFYRFSSTPEPEFLADEEVYVEYPAAEDAGMPESGIDDVSNVQNVLVPPEAPIPEAAPEAPIFNEPVVEQIPPQPQMQPPIVEEQPTQPIIEQPIVEQPTIPQQPIVAQPTVPQQVIPPVEHQEPVATVPVTDLYPQPEKHTSANTSTIDGLPIVDQKNLNENVSGKPTEADLNILIQGDPDDEVEEKGDKTAKVILFGSSKGGTGKTFTCCMSAYWYAKTHPNQKIALADFDIVDGQIGITINKISPTVQQYYTYFINNHGTFDNLYACRVKSDRFSPNIDFYLAPSQDIPQITNNTYFWKNVFEHLITHYDVVFVDTGIDYMGKIPISSLYKIADKIIITSNTSINSVKSVVREFKTIGGQRKNIVFDGSEHILDRCNIVLTRVSDETPAINRSVVTNLSGFAPIIAAFGNIDSIISKIQWEQQWQLIDENPDITALLDEITSFDDEKSQEK